MNYKVIKAHIVDGDSELNIPDSLHITLLIDDRECIVGGLPADMTRKELDEYISKDAGRIKRKAMESDQPKSNKRDDLLDEEYREVN